MGKKLHNLIINKYNLNVVNSMEICSGTFTRANNKIVGEKSVLNYVIASVRRQLIVMPVYI